MRFKESPDPQQKAMMPPGSDEKVMHARVQVGQTIVLLSDGRCAARPKFDGFALSLVVSSEAEADRYFTKLMEGGTATMPLTKTFFSPRFGMLQDRFGVMWMVYVTPQGAGATG
jgi:PhnB protein